MYVYNGRLYYENISFELPHNAKIGIDIEMTGTITIYRTNESWAIECYEGRNKGAESDQESEYKLMTEIMCEPENLNSKLTKRNANGVPYYQLTYNNAEMAEYNGFYLIPVPVGDIRSQDSLILWGNYYSQPSDSISTFADLPVMQEIISSFRLEHCSVQKDDLRQWRTEWRSSRCEK